MILVDSSVWVDHLRAGDAQLASRLASGRVATHPHVIGEVALGSIANRQKVIALLNRLPMAVLAREREVLDLIETSGLFGKGVGYSDAHLLAALRLTPELQFWTRDKRLRQAAVMLKLKVFADDVH